MAINAVIGQAMAGRPSVRSFRELGSGWTREAKHNLTIELRPPHVILPEHGVIRLPCTCDFLFHDPPWSPASASQLQVLARSSLVRNIDKRTWESAYSLWVTRAFAAAPRRSFCFWSSISIDGGSLLITLQSAKSECLKQKTRLDLTTKSSLV